MDQPVSHMPLNYEGPWFSPRPIHVGFVLGTVALRQTFLCIFQVSPVNVILPVLCTPSFIHQRLYIIISATDKVDK